jgi:hypothetical protein
MSSSIVFGNERRNEYCEFEIVITAMRGKKMDSDYGRDCL